MQMCRAKLLNVRPSFYFIFLVYESLYKTDNFVSVSKDVNERLESRKVLMHDSTEVIQLHLFFLEGGEGRRRDKGTGGWNA